MVGDKTKILGISSTFLDYPLSQTTGSKRMLNIEKGHDFLVSEARFAIKIAKQLNPAIKIVLGGAYSHIMKYEEIDTYIVGLGDRAIIEYLKFLDQQNPFFTYKLVNEKMVIDGMLYNNHFNFNESQTKYHESDNILDKELLVTEMARCCIFKCKFCSYQLLCKDKDDYIKNNSAMREEFIRNYEEFGTTQYIFSDDTFNDNIIKLQRLADVAQHLPFKLEFMSYLRLDLLYSKPEQYQYLKDSGLVGCFFGIETLNHESGKCIGKGLHPDKIIMTTPFRVIYQLK